MQTAEKQKVLEAVKDLKLKVTVADVAAKTGLPLLVANRELNTIAAETGGHLQVATTGDIAYSFKPGFEATYFSTGLKRTFEVILKKTLEIGYFLLRISFGIMLILSLITVVILVMIVLRSGRSSDSGRDDSFSFDFFDYMLLRDLFWWGAWNSPSPYDYYSYGNQPYRRVNRQQKGNFLFNCFSFLFGDGNPNTHLEERKWSLIAQAIKQHGGVMTSEELAPYTGHNPINEDGVLPVLVRFNGVPKVTDNGNIVYTFPELQKTATALRDDNLPKFLSEWPWRFTQVDVEELIPVYLVSGLVFLGSWWLHFALLHRPDLYSLMPITNLITVYGTLFLAVPAIRWGVLQVLNGKIETRNTQRQTSAQIVENAPEELRTKLIEAREYKLDLEHVDQQEVVYTTEKDSLDQSDALDEKFKAMEGGNKIDIARKKLEKEFDASP